MGATKTNSSWPDLIRPSITSQKKIDHRVKPGDDERKRSSIQHPLGLGAVERKGRHVHLEPLAAFTDHQIASAHEAPRGRKLHASGIFEPLARRQHGLCADQALTPPFLRSSRS